MRWTSEADTELTSLVAAGTHYDEIAEYFGTTRAAIKVRASKLKVRSGKGWTAEDDELLRLYAATLTSAELAKLFIGRTKDAVNQRCWGLGLEGRTDHRLRGDEHPNYRGGCQQTDRGPTWQQDRLAALERDGYHCQQDGCRFFAPTGRGLVVHHVVPWRVSESNELWNLQTLCVDHHLGYARPEHFMDDAELGELLAIYEVSAMVVAPTGAS